MRKDQGTPYLIGVAISETSKVSPEFEGSIVSHYWNLVWSGVFLLSWVNKGKFFITSQEIALHEGFLDAPFG
jgi:hypothetical protein